jgi:hypothetical protein
MKKHILVLAGWSLAFLLVNTPGAAWADPDPSTVGGGCARQLGMNMDMSDPASREAFHECRQSLLEAGKLNAIPAPSALTPAACPMNPYDILVDTIEDLRNAVADPGNAGATIAIQGLLNVNDDGFANVQILVPGITLTCASDDAGLTGAPVNGALLEVLADAVTVEWLNFSSDFTPAGLNWGIHSVLVNDVIIRHNMLQCRPWDETLVLTVCILLRGGSGGLAEHNTVTGGNIGVVAFLGDNASLRNNSVSEVLTGVLIQDHAGGTAESNEVRNARRGVWSYRSDGPVARGNLVTDSVFGVTATDPAGNVLIDSNHVERCGDFCLGQDSFGNPPSDNSLSITNNTALECTPPGGFPVRCVNATGAEEVIVADNYLQQSPDLFGGVSTAIEIGGGRSADVRNNRVKGSIGVFQISDQASVTGNVIEDCGDNLACLQTFADSGNVLISDNVLTRTGIDAHGQGILAEAIGFGAVNTEIRDNQIDGMFEVGIFVPGDVFDPAASRPVSILRNNIEIAGGIFGEGIRHFGFGGYEGGRIEHNRIHLLDVPSEAILGGGIVIFGNVFNLQFFDPAGNPIFEFGQFNPLRNYLVANNVVRGGTAGLVADSTCSSAFVGNALQGNDVGAVFGLVGEQPTVFPDGSSEIIVAGGTGANAFAGNRNSVEEATFFDSVVGDGYLDCDGNGSSDPNRYAGARGIERGNFGQLLGDIVSEVRSRNGDPSP